MEGISIVKCNLFLDSKSKIEPCVLSTASHLLSTASQTDSGRSLLLVSGSRKQRTLLTNMTLPHIKGGIEILFLANALIDGAKIMPILLIKEEKPTAVCLKEKRTKVLVRLPRFCLCVCFATKIKLNGKNLLYSPHSCWEQLLNIHSSHWSCQNRE